MFHKVLATFGQGGATVDAILDDRSVRPGGVLRGKVDLIGGRLDQSIESLAVAMLAKVETADDRGRHSVADMPFQTVRLGGNATVQAGQKQTVPFQVQVPWEVPITTIQGQQLAGIAVGLQTTVEVAGSISTPQDVDAVTTEPLPAQQRVLDALTRLGFTFTDAGIAMDQVRGADQQLPFHHDIWFAPPPQFEKVFTDVELTFLARPRDLQVVLDVGRKVRYGKGGGLGQPVQREVGMFVLPHPEAGRQDWERQLTGWLGEVARPRGIFG